MNFCENDNCVAFDYNFPIYNWFFPFNFKKLDEHIEAEVSQNKLNIFNFAGKAPKFRALYFHIPFCQDICLFCHFTREICLDEEIYDKYADAVVHEIKLKTSYENLSNHPVTAIFFGGGTPSILMPKQIRKIGNAIRENFNLSGLKEFSYEMNAKTVTPDRIEALKEIGVTHARMGVQTFNPRYRALFGLTATLDQVYKGAQLLNDNFENVCIDMLYGLHGQTPGEFIKDMHHAVGLGTSAIDVYPINNMVTQPLLSKKYEEENLTPTSGLDKFSLNMLLNEYMRANGYAPHNGHGYVKADKAVIEQRPVVTDTYRFQYHEAVYGYKGHEIIGFGSAAFSSFDCFSLANCTNPRKYMADLLEKSQIDMAIGQYDEKLCDIKGIVLHLPYHGEAQKAKMDLNLIPDEIKDNVAKAVNKGLVTENETEYRLTNLGWYWYVNLLYQLLPQTEKEKLLAFINKQTAQERSTEDWKINLSIFSGRGERTHAPELQMASNSLAVHAPLTGRCRQGGKHISPQPLRQ